MYTTLGTLLFCLFCYHNADLYLHVQNDNKQLSSKQKAYILSIKSAFTLLLVSLAFNVIFWNVGGDIHKYKLHFEENEGSKFWAQATVIYFTSHLVMDCILGKMYYSESMKSLSGYPHHIVYIMLNTIILAYGLEPEYLLFFLSELPTFLLSLGSFNKKYRSDSIFGATFLLTRILYHIYLTIRIRSSVMVTSFCVLILCLHIFWFYKWVRSYIEKKKNSKSN